MSEEIKGQMSVQNNMLAFSILLAAVILGGSMIMAAGSLSTALGEVKLVGSNTQTGDNTIPTGNTGDDTTAPQELQLGELLAASTCEGQDDAPVVMIVATDQQCPFCERHESTTIIQLEANEVKNGKVKLCQFAFPLSFHPYAQKGGEATYCAKEQGKYWEMSHLIFDNQDGMVDGADQVAFYKGLAGQISGIDTATFENCMTSGKYTKQVQDEYQLGVKLGVSGTPTSFIGLNKGSETTGTAIVGAQATSTFQAAISALLNA